MPDYESKRERPLNTRELLSRLHTLGFNERERTLERKLWRWAHEGLIPSPEKRRGLGQGQGSTASVWPESTVWKAAGVWALRDGSGKKWSRKERGAKIIKLVQKFTKKVWTHPYVALSISDDTRDDYDPPLQDVACSVFIECSTKIESLIILHFLAIVKAFWGWPIKAPALVTFYWGDPVRVSESGEFERPLDEISVNEAPDAKDDLRFIVDGRDVRERLLRDRALMRKLRQSSPPFFERLRSLMRRLRESDPRYVKLNNGQPPLTELLRSSIHEFGKDDPQFYTKLRSLMRTLRESENDPQFYEQLKLLTSTIREQDPELSEKLAVLKRAIGGRSFGFIEQLRLPITTSIKLSLAKEPLDTTFIHDMYQKAHLEKIDDDEDYYYKEIYKKYKRNVKEQPDVPQRELDFLLSVASSYDELKKNDGEADSTDRQKRTRRQKKPSKR
jgi:hypothetical protein